MALIMRLRVYLPPNLHTHISCADSYNTMREDCQSSCKRTAMSCYKLILSHLSLIPRPHPHLSSLTLSHPSSNQKLYYPRLIAITCFILCSLQELNISHYIISQHKSVLSVVSSPSSSGRVGGVLSILIWSCRWCPLHPHLVVSVVSSPSSSGRVGGVLSILIWSCRWCPPHPHLVVSVVSSPSSSGRVGGVLSILVWSCMVSSPSSSGRVSGVLSILICFHTNPQMPSSHQPLQRNFQCWTTMILLHRCTFCYGNIGLHKTS